MISRIAGTRGFVPKVTAVNTPMVSLKLGYTLTASAQSNARMVLNAVARFASSIMVKTNAVRQQAYMRPGHRSPQSSGSPLSILPAINCELV